MAKCTEPAYSALLAGAFTHFYFPVRPGWVAVLFDGTGILPAANNGGVIINLVEEHQMKPAFLLKLHQYYSEEICVVLKRYGYLPWKGNLSVVTSSSVTVSAPEEQPSPITNSSTLSIAPDGAMLNVDKLVFLQIGYAADVKKIVTFLPNNIDQKGVFLYQAFLNQLINMPAATAAFRLSASPAPGMVIC